jgi:hypothetical protein
MASMKGMDQLKSVFPLAPAPTLALVIAAQQHQKSPSRKFSGQLPISDLGSRPRPCGRMSRLQS